MLDDYQAITEPSCHEQIAFLLLHLPPSVQIVLITRTDPPVPLAGLRAAGDLAEFRGPQLRFAAAEAARLVRATSGVRPQRDRPRTYSSSGPRDGRPGSTSPRSRYAAIPHRAPSSASSAATTGSSPTS